MITTNEIVKAVLKISPNGATIDEIKNLYPVLAEADFDEIFGSLNVQKYERVCKIKNCPADCFVLLETQLDQVKFMLVQYFNNQITELKKEIQALREQTTFSPHNIYSEVVAEMKANGELLCKNPTTNQLEPIVKTPSFKDLVKEIDATIPTLSKVPIKITPSSKPVQQQTEQQQEQEDPDEVFKKVLESFNTGSST